MTFKYDWHQLRAQANRLGVRVLNRAISLNALYEQRDELLDEAEAIKNLAEKEERDFTDDEDGRLGAILDEKTGDLAKLQAKIDAAEKRDREMKRLAAIRQAARSDDEIVARHEGALPIETTDENPRIFHKMARLKAFANNQEGCKEAYYCGMWLRAIGKRCRAERDEQAEQILAKRGWTPQAAATEGTDTAGGFLVPDPLSSAIIDIREEVGITRRLADVVPMSSNTQDIPKRTGGLTVYYPGEANTVTTSDMTFGRVNLVAIKRAVANQISSELSDDAVINMTDRAVTEQGYALALQEDNEYLNGDGTSTYGGELGWLNAIGSAGIETPANGGGESVWTGITTGTISAWFGKLPSKFWMRGQLAIVCSSAFYFNVFDRLMQAAGGNTNATLRSGGIADLADAMYHAYPVFFTDRMPVTTAVSQTSALFGNFGMSSIIGDRTGVRMAMSTDYAFLDDVVTLLATSRYDINIHEAGDSSAAGGVVGLSTAAS